MFEVSVGNVLLNEGFNPLNSWAGFFLPCTHGGEHSGVLRYSVGSSTSSRRGSYKRCCSAQ
jgi:hypothetical protein